MAQTANLKARSLVWSALCLSLPLLTPPSPTQAQTTSTSKHQWKSEFRVATYSSFASPRFYSTWLPKLGAPNPCFDLRGGVFMVSKVTNEAACRRINFDQDPNSLAMEWQTNAPKFELMCAASWGTWRVQVRDTNSRTWSTIGEWNSRGWTAPRTQIFSDVMGARRMRRFRVEYSNQLAWGIRLENRESIIAAPPKPYPRRILWCGDSFVEGVFSPSLWQGFAGQASAILGLDAHFDASGGTGYLNPSPSPKRVRYDRRLSNIVEANPSVVVMYGSINDLLYAPTQVARTASTYWKNVQRALPNAQIIVMGPVRMGTAWDTKALNDALKQAAVSNGFSYIDASNWVTGSGKLDAPRRDGNADQFRDSDGAHPTPAGHEFLGQKVAQALRPLLVAK